MIRQQAGVSVARFCELAEILTSTWYRRRALGGRPGKGPWPRPVRERVTVAVIAHALARPAWGHRKIWALTVADGHEVSMRTVHRILDERGPAQRAPLPGRTTRARMSAPATAPRRPTA